MAAKPQSTSEPKSYSGGGGMKKLILVVGIFSLMSVALIQFLNFTGFCYGQRRYLSDKELIEAGIAYQMNNTREYYSQGAIKYSSKENFIQLNRGCCFLTRDGHPGLDLEIWGRIFGWYYAVVEIWYRLKNEGAQQFWYEYVYVDACGKVGFSWGHENSYGPTGVRE
jgi:hypothetical protein